MPARHLPSSAVPRDALRDDERRGGTAIVDYTRRAIAAHLAGGIHSDDPKCAPKPA
jgi:hypothetical protein